MRHGISFIPRSGIFKGLRISLMQSYADPLLFTLEQAQEYHKNNKHLFKLLKSVQIVNEDVARKQVANVVEVYSGKKIIESINGSRKFIDYSARVS